MIPAIDDPPEAQVLRRNMIQTQLEARGITDARVLQAMAKVPRHLFAPFPTLQKAYEDGAFEIECGQTISQPYMVAYMTQALEIQHHHRILEVGTGSGYQTAVLCELSSHIYSIERHPSLAQQAKQRLLALGYRHVNLYVGDGEKGLPEAGPFDRIMVTAAACRVPRTLIQQLAPEGGIIVFPQEIKPGYQELIKRVRYANARDKQMSLGGVRFVPLVLGEVCDTAD